MTQGHLRNEWPTYVGHMALALVAACARDTEDTVRRDGWLVQPMPVLDIPATDANGEVVFAHPVAATRLSNGTVVIGDRLGPAVLFLDSSGRAIRTVGREGEGPGEFRAVTWLGQCGADSVYVWDGALRRMSVVDAGGRVTRQFAVPVRLVWQVACSRASELAVVSWPDLHTPFPGTDPPRASADLVLIDRDGREIAVIGQIPIFSDFPPPPLSRSTTVALSGVHLFVASADSAFIDQYTLAGQLVAVLPVGTRPRPPSTLHFERAVDALLADVARAELRQPLREEMLKHYSPPELLPPYRAAFTDMDGLLWVETSFPGDSMTVLWAIGADGNPIAELLVPQQIQVFEIGVDYLLGAYEEESGEPHVVVYPLERSR